MSMTEADWLTTTTRAAGMLRKVQRVGGRKPLLAACGVCRLVWDLLPDDRCRDAVAAVERAADGDDAGFEAIRAAFSERAGPYDDVLQMIEWPSVELELVWSTLWATNADHLRVAVNCFERLRPRSGFLWAKPSASVCDLLREIYGNPYRPRKIVAEWLGGGWLQPDGAMFAVPESARGIAAAVRADQGFGRLPVLADALEDAGCTDAEVLAHCREPRDHARGCWAVDLVLGIG